MSGRALHDWRSLLRALAVMLAAAAAITSSSWLQQPRVLVSSGVEFGELGSAADRVLADADRYGATAAVVVLSEGASTGAPDLPSSPATRFIIVAVSADQRASLIEAGFDEEQVISPTRADSISDDIRNAVGVDAHYVDADSGLRSALRRAAWATSPGLLITLVFIAGIALAALARRWAGADPYLAAAIVVLAVVFAPSINGASFLLVMLAAMSLLIAGLPRLHRPHPRSVVHVEPPPRPRPAPQPIPPHPPPPPGPDLIEIGSPSRLAASVGLAPPSETMTSELRSAELTILGASAAGAGHLEERKGLEDSHAIASWRDGRTVVAAVADGVGSAASSKVGSDFAAAEAVRELVDRVEVVRSDEELGDAAVKFLLASIEAVNRRLAAHARGSSPPMQLPELATTLVAIVAWRDGQQLRYAAARVGDSNAFVAERGTWTPVFDGDDSDAELSDTTTFTLPSSTVRIEHRTGSASREALLVLATDGIADPLAGSRDEVRSALWEMWSRPPTLADFVRQVQFSRRGLSDDRTAVGIWQVDGAGARETTRR